MTPPFLSPPCRHANHGRVVVVPIQGYITQYLIADVVVDLVAAIRRQPPEALVVLVNTVGGSEGASARLHEVLDGFREVLPVVAAVDRYALSAGFSLLSHVDYVIARPGSRIGGWGTGRLVCCAGDVHALGTSPGKIDGAWEYGVVAAQVTKAELPEIRAEMRRAVEAELTLMEAARGIPVHTLLPLAEGVQISGRKAKALGIVDEVAEDGCPDDLPGQRALELAARRD